MYVCVPVFVYVTERHRERQILLILFFILGAFFDIWRIYCGILTLNIEHQLLLPWAITKRFINSYKDLKIHFYKWIGVQEMGVEYKIVPFSIDEQG